MDGEGASLPKVDVVQVELEDFFLGCPAFQDNGQESLEELPPQRSLRGQEVVLDQLLSEGAPSLA